MAEGRSVQRKLAAILVADIAGYSRLMGADEEGTLARMKALRAEVIDPAIARGNGRIVKTTGDGLLVEFASVVDAMRCAIGWQKAMREGGEGSIEFRIGVNLGDVIIDGDDIFGDGVNIAARLEGLSTPGGVCISRAVLTQTLGKLDFTVEDLGEQALKNIAQPIHVFRVMGEPKPMLEPSVLPLPDKPSIAVLPFQNMSGDPEQEYFADGMVEEIITALSRIRWLFVIARNSTFTYKGQAVDVKRVGRELGVRYVLEGSVRKGGGRVRITAQLIEAESGTHLWADRFDGSMEDVFDLQDQVATSVAGVIEPTLQLAEVQRASPRPTNDLTAYDLYLRAYATMLSPARNVPEVLRLLDEAIARDPDFGPALAWAAICHTWIDTQGGIADPEANRRKGLERGRRALQLAADDPAILANASFALAGLGEDVGAMIAMVDRALGLNLSFARGWHASGCMRVYAGQPDLAIQHVENALRLSPRARVGWSFAVIGFAHFCAGRFEEAIQKLLFAVQEDPNYAPPYRFLAASYAHLGRADAAREIIGRLRAMDAEVMNDALWLRNPEHRELYLSGLRLAMGEG